MTYRKYSLWMRPTAECQECGARVRLRGFWWTVVAGGAVVVIWALSPTLEPLVFVSLVLPLLALDYASYRLLKWHPEEGTDAGEQQEVSP